METLIVDRADGVVTVTLNRPEKKNAINGPMWRELIEVFDEVADTPGDRALVFTGAGDGFCSGADLSPGNNPDLEVQPGGIGSTFRQMRVVGRAALRLHHLPQPTIAAVNGVAAGAGLNMALGCDLIIASERARFTEIFSKRGLNVDFGGSWLLRRLNQSFSVSMADALEFEDTAQAMNFASKDTAEAMVAFLQKRDPTFTGE